LSSTSGLSSRFLAGTDSAGKRPVQNRADQSQGIGASACPLRAQWALKNRRNQSGCAKRGQERTLRPDVSGSFALTARIGARHICSNVNIQRFDVQTDISRRPLRVSSSTSPGCASVSVNSILQQATGWYPHRPCSTPWLQTRCTLLEHSKMVCTRSGRDATLRVPSQRTAVPAARQSPLPFAANAFPNPGKHSILRQRRDHLEVFDVPTRRGSAGFARSSKRASSSTLFDPFQYLRPRASFANQHGVVPAIQIGKRGLTRVSTFAAITAKDQRDRTPANRSPITGAPLNLFDAIEQSRCHHGLQYLPPIADQHPRVIKRFSKNFLFHTESAVGRTEQRHHLRCRAAWTSPEKVRSSQSTALITPIWRAT